MKGRGSMAYRTLALALLSAAFLAAPAMAQDKKAPATAPKAADAKAADGKPVTTKGLEGGEEDRTVFVDNEKFIATENRYKPGAKSAMRERGERVSRAMTEGTIERTYKDGKKETITWKKGEVKYQPKATFEMKNVGKTEFVV